MSSATIARTFAVGAVTVAAALVLWNGGRAPTDVRLPPSSATDPAPVEIVPHIQDSPADAPETPAAAKLRELEAMSETYRNTTFLIAIRDAGFVCNELLRVYGALDDAPKWLASCSEMLSYTVGVASNGTLHVEPMMQYFDGPVLRIDQNGELVQPAEPGVRPR